MKDSNQLEQYVTVKEAAEILTVSIYTIIRYLKAGYIKGCKLPSNAQWRILKSSLYESLSKE